MRSILDIRPENSAHDFQKSGYYNNIVVGTFKVFDSRLLPFFYPFADTRTVLYTISAFTLQALDCNGSPAIEYSLSTSFMDIVIKNNKQVFLYDGTADILGSLSAYEEGIHRFRIEVSTGRKYRSEPFWIDKNAFASLQGDYNEDFSSDFNVFGL